MYGFIHKGLFAYLRHLGGPELVARVRADSVDEDESVVSLERYDDGRTARLVRRTCEILGRGEDELLQDFGRYWINFVHGDGYGPVLATAGYRLFDILDNLDNLHSRLESAFPGSIMPSFATVHLGPDELELTYRSDREGFEWFLIGIIHGIARHLGNEVRVELVGEQDCSAGTPARLRVFQ